jgi:hypothetical protein
MIHRAKSASGLLGALGLMVLGCAQDDVSAPGTDHRYHLEPLASDLSGEVLDGSASADLDGDGISDQIIQNYASVQIIMSSGGEFRYSVREMGEDSATGVTGFSLLSFNRDGTYPSVVLATERDPPGDRPALVHQQIIFNDHGSLLLKTLADYPVNARDVDCGWLNTNDLPVCFYASYGPDLGRTKLIELDPNGLRQMAADTAYLNLRYRVSALYDPGAVPGHPSARQQAMAWGGVGIEIVDSLLAMGWADHADSFVDSVRALSFGLSDRQQMYSADITRDYRLPWPVELSRAYDRGRHPRGHWMDGYMMVGSVFLDFTGDGLLDLVSVGQHSGVFSAVQHPDGYFTDAGYHGLPDDYHKVRAPVVTQETGLTAPPCVLFSMEEDSAAKPDYVECYDSRSGEWYEVLLPGGPYWTDYLPVEFRDFDGDGMLDLAFAKKDGRWVAFRFVADEAVGTSGIVSSDPNTPLDGAD